MNITARNRIVAVLLALAMVVSLPLVFNSSAYRVNAGIDDPSLYWVDQYHSGQCVLVANVFMIRRALYLRGSSAYNEVTVAAAKQIMTTDGEENMRWNYTYSVGGYNFYVKCGSHNADSLAAYISNHPEGVVTHSGWHAALTTGFNGSFYGIDYAYGGGSTMALDSCYANGSCWYIVCDDATPEGNPYASSWGKTEEPAQPTSYEEIVDGHRTYVKDGVRVTGLFDFPNVDGTTTKVFYDENGYMQYDWIVANGQTYYADPETGAIVENKERVIDGDWYYFEENGEMATGLTQTATGKEILYDEDGTMKYGWVVDVDDSPGAKPGDIAFGKQRTLSGVWRKYINIFTNAQENKIQAKTINPKASK